MNQQIPYEEYLDDAKRPEAMESAIQGVLQNVSGLSIVSRNDLFGCTVAGDPKSLEDLESYLKKAGAGHTVSGGEQQPLRVS